MNEHTATEQSFNNGYRLGYAKAIKDILVGNDIGATRTIKEFVDKIAESPVSGMSNSELADYLFTNE